MYGGVVGGDMAYVPDWERLSDALKRVKATGASEDEAKIGITRAIADQKIQVRLTIATGSADISGIFSGANIEVPKRLMPLHFDWSRSRPRAAWLIGPREWKSSERHSYTWRDRPISLIELCTADVSAFIEMIGTKQSADTYEKSTGTVDQEHRARKVLAGRLKKNQNMTPRKLKIILSHSGTLRS
jgi:hypothetical protein